MPKRHNREIEKLAKQINALRDDVADLGDSDDLKSLLLIIRRPGWTSVAELAFARGVVESLRVQVQAVAGLKKSLVEACGLVAEE
jgi:hypothetical protein